MLTDLESLIIISTFSIQIFLPDFFAISILSSKPKIPLICTLGPSSPDVSLQNKCGPGVKVSTLQRFVRLEDTNQNFVVVRESNSSIFTHLDIFIISKVKRVLVNECVIR